MKQPEHKQPENCLHCRHGDFAGAADLIGKTKNAMACRAAGFPERHSVRPVAWPCGNGRFERADVEIVAKRKAWIDTENRKETK